MIVTPRMQAQGYQLLCGRVATSILLAMSSYQGSKRSSYAVHAITIAQHTCDAVLAVATVVAAATSAVVTESVFLV
jgi:hypothetical protein